MSNYELPDYSKVKDALAPMPEMDPHDAYSGGFVGAYHDPEGDEISRDSVVSEGMPFEMEDIATSEGFADQAKAGTYVIWKEIEKVGLPTGTIGKVSQMLGNCVGRATQVCLYGSFCSAVASGEGSIPPEAFEAAKSPSNPVCSEPHYWLKWGQSSRRAGGDGWHATASLAAAKDHAGLVWRKDYTSVGGPNLWTENRGTVHWRGWGAVPDTFKSFLHQHPLRTYSKCSSFQQVADAISAGYAVQSDGGQGISKSHDEWGVSRRSGSWSHSMSVLGVVSTDEAKRRYRTEGLLYWSNSWGNWNSVHGAKVFGTDILLPPGCYATTWETMRNRSFYAVSPVKGWPNRKLPDWSIRSKGLV
jgi:hypothetical protein